LANLICRRTSRCVPKPVSFCVYRRTFGTHQSRLKPAPTRAEGAAVKTRVCPVNFWRPNSWNTRRLGNKRRNLSVTRKHNYTGFFLLALFHFFPFPLRPYSQRANRDDTAFLLDIEIILFRTFGGEWQIWSAVAEVAPRVWVRTRDVFATADTAFDRSYTFKFPRCARD
jgi:hypothetical protein